MDINPSSIDSPLALIALFVAMIELFLLYPLAKLEGPDRSRIVWFVIAFPVFIALSFFLFLWFKPVNLYSPEILPEDLQKAFIPEVKKEAAQDVAASIAPLNSQIKQLEEKLGFLTKDITSLQSSVESARPSAEEIKQRQEVTSNFAENSKYKALVFYRDSSQEIADLINNHLLAQGYQAATIKTDFTELNKIQPESGKISIVYTARGETQLRAITKILEALSPKPNVVPNFRSTTLSRGDLQLLVF